MGRNDVKLNKQPPWWKKLWGWTGFGEKKLWDWLQLLSALAIPVILAVVGFWFADQQQKQQRTIETQRAKHEREIQEQQAQDIALQAYLTQMGKLILEEDLRDTDEVSEKVRTLARVRTITVLSRVDPARKHSVMQFLIEANLVQGVDRGGECCKEPIIDLDGVTLRDVTFLDAPLEGASLLNADLSGANLRGAYLPDADLGGVNLDETNLSGASLRDADLSDADLSDAHLEGADLSHAGLTNADLRGADLSGAGLTNTDLSDADLSGAKGITKERLEAEAKAFEGATMPDGQRMPSAPEPLAWGGPISAGKYVIDELEPTIRLKVGKGWVAAKADLPPMLLENPRTGEGQLIFTSPIHVFDPSNPSERKKKPAPDNADEWASWFQRHPNLETARPTPVSMGGVSGMRIDVTPISNPQDLCHQKPCVPLYPPVVASLADWKDRFVIVDVEGKTVVIDISAPAGEFNEFLSKAQKVLDALEWEGT